MHFGAIVWALALQHPPPQQTHCFSHSFTSLFLTFISRWIRSSSALLSERAIHSCLSSPPNQKGLHPHCLLPFGTMLSMQTAKHRLKAKGRKVRFHWSAMNDTKTVRVDKRNRKMNKKREDLMWSLLLNISLNAKKLV